MKRLGLVVIQWLAIGLTCAASNAAVANILIQIDKPYQTMTVAVDGQLRYRWRVSTGATGYYRLLHSLSHGGNALLAGMG
jgi:hypothetical protein